MAEQGKPGMSRRISLLSGRLSALKLPADLRSQTAFELCALLGVGGRG